MSEFIVNIYRQADRKTLTGLVEDMRQGVKKKFHSSDELLNFLQKPDVETQVDRKGEKENNQG